MRLIDQVLRKPLFLPTWAIQPRVPRVNEEEFKAKLRGVPAIVVDNVAEYLYSGITQDEWDLTKDFPTLMPPFQSFWMETNKPSAIIHTEDQPGATRALQDMPARWGVLFESTTLPEGSESRSLLTRMFGARLDLPFALLTATPVFYVEGHSVLPPITIVTALNRAGVALGPHVASFHQSLVADAASDSLQKRFDQIAPQLLPFYLAISFMHCKNVSRREETPPPALSKAHQRRYGAPLQRFTVLDIDPMRQVLKSEGGAESTGLVKALHICRGHFKTYSERPLFGRIKGTFWWPSSVRGTIAAGVVAKTYDVKGKS